MGLPGTGINSASESAADADPMVIDHDKFLLTSILPHRANYSASSDTLYDPYFISNQILRADPERPGPARHQTLRHMDHMLVEYNLRVHERPLRRTLKRRLERRLYGFYVHVPLIMIGETVIHNVYPSSQEGGLRVDTTSF
jgi:hypothetical protein